MFFLFPFQFLSSRSEWELLKDIFLVHKPYKRKVKLLVKNKVSSYFSYILKVIVSVKSKAVTDIEKKSIDLIVLLSVAVSILLSFQSV